MGLLRDLRKAGITAQQIIDLVENQPPKEIHPAGPIGPLNTVPTVPVISIVEVTGNAGGGGVYEGLYPLDAPEIDNLDATANVRESNFGNFDWPSVEEANGPEQGECYVFNMAEEGQSTHDLTEGSPIAKRFIGVFLGYEKADGKPCFGINGLDYGNCT